MKAEGRNVSYIGSKGAWVTKSVRPKDNYVHGSAHLEQPRRYYPYNTAPHPTRYKAPQLSLTASPSRPPPGTRGAA